MENTQSVQFADDQAEWYVSFGEKYRGPFRASEIYQKLLNKEVSWIDFCYREKDAAQNGGQWVRIADHAVFKSLQPEPPKPKPVVAAPPPPPRASEPEIKWFLFQNENQTGPYGTQELKRMILNQQVIQGAFVWQENFTDWKPFESVNELKVATPPPAPAATVASVVKISAPVPAPLIKARLRPAPKNLF